MSIYERIKNRRKELGLSAEDVASALNVSRATVYRYESSDIEKFPTASLEPLANVLKCSPAYLMGWDSAPNSSSVVMDADELSLIRSFRELDGEGRKKLLERANELIALLYVRSGNNKDEN